MRLPVIKHLNNLIDEYDKDYIEETLLVLESIIDARGIKEEEKTNKK